MIVLRRRPTTQQAAGAGKKKKMPGRVVERDAGGCYVSDGIVLHTRYTAAYNILRE